MKERYLGGGFFALKEQFSTSFLSDLGLHQTVILAVVLYFFFTCISQFRAFISALAHFNEDPQNEEVNKTFPEPLLLTLMHFY